MNWIEIDTSLPEYERPVLLVSQDMGEHGEKLYLSPGIWCLMRHNGKNWWKSLGKSEAYLLENYKNIKYWCYVNLPEGVTP